MAWDKKFLKKLFKLGGPIMLQNLFTVLGNSVTTFMTGRLGDFPIAAAGLANQLFFILVLVQFGVSSGCSLFTAQFWGKKDKQSVLKTLGVSLLLGLGVGSVFLVIALFLPRQFLGVFTQNQEVVAIAAGLLRIVGFSFFFTPVIYTYAFVLRSTGNVRLPMAASIIGVFLNITLGYGFVFGKLGLPNLGVNGAAAATLIARVTECLVLVMLIYRFKTPLAVPLRQIFSFDSVFLKKILQRVLPVMTNELVWGLGITAYNAIFARMGIEAYAAVAIKDTIEGIVFVPFFSMTNACAILVGNTIGKGQKEDAQGFVKQTLALNFGLAVILGILLLSSRQFIISYFNITDAARGFGLNIIAVLASVMWLRTSNFVFFIGMMRSGGDTRFAWIMDVLSLWGIGVPLALLGAFVLQLPVYYVYLLVMAEEALKFIISIWRFRSQRWIHDLVTV
ncbi:MAG TPA: MATE family efflux transporter [Pelolinea sp.]|nr:MATE family efflux transporter [Pelolinea sp.]